MSARSTRPAARPILPLWIAASSPIGVIGIAALLAVMVATASLPHGNEAAPSTHLSEGDLAPDFTVQTARRLYDKYRARIHFIAVTESPYARGSTQYFYVRYPVAFDATLGVATSYFQSDLPAIVLIGADKRIQYFGSGEVSGAVLSSQIQRLL